MCCAERRTGQSGRRHQAGAIVLLASAFVFLLSYIALAAVDLAAVEARLADALRGQSSARARLDGALRVVVAREATRLQAALARNEAPVCEVAGFCAGERQELSLGDGDPYRVIYRTRVRGPAATGGPARESQARVFSHLQYRAGHYEVDVRVVRLADNATLARAAVGVAISAAREEGE